MATFISCRWINFYSWSTFAFMVPIKGMLEPRLKIWTRSRFKKLEQNWLKQNPQVDSFAEKALERFLLIRFSFLSVCVIYFSTHLKLKLTTKNQHYLHENNYKACDPKRNYARISINLLSWRATKKLLVCDIKDCAFYLGWQSTGE